MGVKKTRRRIIIGCGPGNALGERPTSELLYTIQKSGAVPSLKRVKWWGQPFRAAAVLLRGVLTLHNPPGDAPPQKAAAG